jgi:hypothetical protein
MSTYKELKTLASAKLADLAYKELLSLKYNLKDKSYKKGRIYGFIQDIEGCLDCETEQKLKIKLK